MLNWKQLRLYFIVGSLSFCLLVLILPTSSSLAAANSVLSLDWSSDGSKIAIALGSGAIEIRDAASMQTLLTLQTGAAPITAATWNPINDSTHRNILAVSDDAGFIEIYDVIANQRLIKIECCAFVSALAWSPDGSLLASGSQIGEYPLAIYAVQVWDPSTGQLQVSPGSSDVPISEVAWSPDGIRIAADSRDYTAIISDVEAGTEKVVLRGHTDNVGALAWNPIIANNRLATGSGANDHSIRIWDAGNGQQLFMIPNTYAIDLKWSPDGQWLAAASGELLIYDMRSGRIGEIAARVAARYVSAIAWSPDSSKLVYSTSGGDVQIINAPQTSPSTSTPVRTSTDTLTFTPTPSATDTSK